ncbi:hypothetical protein [Pseudomonas chlororaphis]
MGRQITVELGDLEKVGCNAEWHKDESNSENEWVEITLPDGRSIHSCFSDCLNFDCRSIEHSTNAWMEQWLIDNNVPYAHG